MSEVEAQVIEVEPPKRKPKSWEKLGNLVSGLDTWELQFAKWADDKLVISGGPLNPQMISPKFVLEENTLYVFRFKGMSDKLNPLALMLVDANNDTHNFENAVKMTAVEDGGDFVIGFSFAPEKTGEFKLALCNYYGNFQDSCEVLSPTLDVKVSSSTVNSLEWHDVDTNLPHWGPLKRWIHKKCKNSKLFNSFVAGVEMRLGRKEVVSLPMYMALCPTGQCNALCEFCSVTINRTGIIKRELSFQKIQRFLEPTLKTIYMYGLEGNGEPTMYGEFDPLVSSLTRHNADAYLITNGALLKADQISHLLNFQSITFSLNASTAETHVAVMKLRNKFDNVIKNIKSLVTQRGFSQNPQIFVSFVVNHHNIHELQHFLNFAENELKIDVIMIRPLSELGADAGTLEDLRDIVPYESLVQDALESAHEYLHDVPRRVIPNASGRICDIRIDPASFRNVRPDPMDQIIEVPGYEGRFLAPRRKYWTVLQEKFDVSWYLNKATLSFPEEGYSGELWKSQGVPVMPEKDLSFQAKVALESGSFTIEILNDKGELLQQQLVESSIEDLKLEFNTGDSEKVFLKFVAAGNILKAQIDFERVVTPGPGLQTEFKLPIPRRWQVDTAGVVAKWTANQLSLDSGKGGLNGKYLFKSYSVPCRKHTKLSLPVNINVLQGTLSIGVLSEDFQSWTHKFEYKQGEHDISLELETGDNAKLQLVLFAKGDEQLKVDINWKNTLELPPEREDWSKNDSFFVESPEEKQEDQSTVQTAKKSGDFLPIKWFKAKKSAKSQPKYYCSKPWTDLNNFTVDGRMDVCCITTGASQEHYALGNILEQNFQEVWNGKVIQDFRETVNTPDKKLPPCARCPMAYSYQGPFVSKAQTEIALIEAFREIDPSKPEWYKKCMTAIGLGLSKVVNNFYFRGFKD